MLDAMTLRLAQKAIGRRASGLVFAEMGMRMDVEDSHENSPNGDTNARSLDPTKSLTSSG